MIDLILEFRCLMEQSHLYLAGRADDAGRVQRAAKHVQLF